MLLRTLTTGTLVIAIVLSLSGCQSQQPTAPVSTPSSPLTEQPTAGQPPTSQTPTGQNATGQPPTSQNPTGQSSTGQATPSPAITYADPLYERLAKEQPGAVVLKSVIADLNRDGKKELAVAFQPTGSKGATVAILPESGSLITLQQIDEASWVNRLVVLDHGNTVHLVVIQLIGRRPYLGNIWALEGLTPKDLGHLEADQSITVENNQIISKRQFLQNTGPMIIQTSVLTWDPGKNDYVLTMK